jgi:hypothetical protein
MKKLLLLLLVSVCTFTANAQCLYNTQFGYVNYMINQETNLNGFRLAYWPNQYRNLFYNPYGRNPGGRVGSTCFDNNYTIGFFGDLAFTPSNEDKTKEKQTISLGLIAPIFPQAGFNVYLGAGTTWNNGDDDEYESESTSVLGVTYIVPDAGFTLTIGRQTGFRDMFGKNGGNFILGLGYTIRR